jgi:predicted nucleic acid-binding protein
MITLDTSGILALLDRRDRHHRAATDLIAGIRQAAVVPAGILAEADRVLSHRLAPGASLIVLHGIERGDTLLDCGDTDLPRIRELMTRFHDLPLGFADAAVVACGERNGGTVLTFDRRDLDVVAGEVPITLVP